MNGLVLWVPLQYINFRFVPMRWRVLFIDIVHFFWCVACTLSPTCICTTVHLLPFVGVQGHLHVRRDYGIEECKRS